MEMDNPASAQEGPPMSRRRSSTASTASTVSSVVGNGHMSEGEQEERRRHIKSIMCDSTLSQKEKSRNIQALMDGRQPQSCRRSSTGSCCSNASSAYVSSMADAAAIAAEYYSDETEENGESVMGDASYSDHHHHHHFQNRDERSVASSVTSHEQEDAENDQQQQPAPVTAAGSYRQYHGRSYSLQDWKEMDRVTAAANTTVLSHNPVQVSRLMEQSRPACEHYERRCTIISPCCGLAFGCRICHDDCPVLPPPLASRRLSASTIATTNHKNKLERRRSMPVDLEEEEEEHHLIDRFKIKEVICRDCYARQSSKSNNCLSCGVQFGVYHCSICNLWMSDTELPYHCEDCGFCRVGGRENFKHCDDCGMCIDALLFDDHNCKSGKYMSNCPICQEDLFSSRFASHEMPCGHAIHWHCFKELTSYDTRCPVCKKTAESPEQMAATWSAIAMGIALQPVPPDMARVVNILCYDCESSDRNLRWHFLGVRCTQCLSFNTTVEQIVMHGCDAAVYLDRLEASYNSASAGGVPSNISMPVAAFVSTQTVALASDNSDSMDEDDMPSAQGMSSAGSSDLMDRVL